MSGISVGVFSQTVYAVSIFAARSGEVLVTEDKIDENATHINHSAGLITADSEEDAAREALDLIRESYPSEDGWTLSVMVRPYLLNVAAETIKGVQPRLNVSIDPMGETFSLEHRQTSET